MFYARVPLQSRPAGAFVYVLHNEGSNYIQVGLGYESANGLQVSHVDGVKIHQLHVHEVADSLETSESTLVLKTGRLAPFFLDAENIVFPTEGQWAIDGIDQRKMISDLIRAMHDDVWGHPENWNVLIKSLGDGRLFWLAYDGEMDKIKLGIGYHTEVNDAALGDTVYAYSREFIAEEACRMFHRPKPLYFFGRPPRWPQGFSPWVNPPLTRQIAIELIRMADKVWKGDLPMSRVLTDAERENHQTP